MTYFLEDAVGNYLGDLASNLGLRDMREQDRLPRLTQFISEGQVTEGEMPNLRAELQGDSEYGYVLEMLDAGELPIIVTDGVGSTEDEEGEEEEEPIENYTAGQPRDGQGRFGSGGGGGGAKLAPDTGGGGSGGGSSKKVSYSNAEKEAVEEISRGLYRSKDGGFDSIQGFLRTGNTRSFGVERDPQSLTDTVHSLDSAIAKSNLPQAKTLYRGVGKLSMEIGDAQVGDTFTQKGFTSTSTSQAVAKKKFIEGRADQTISAKKDQALMKIKVAEDTPALDMGKLGIKHEKEVLLARDTTFRVTKKTKSKDGTTVVEVEPVSGSAKPKPLAKPEAGTKAPQEKPKPKPKPKPKKKKEFTSKGYEDQRSIFKEAKGTDQQNNRRLVEASGVKIEAPKHLQDKVTRAVAHVVQDPELNQALKGKRIIVKPDSKKYGTSSRATLTVDEGIFNKKSEGVGFAAGVIRHEVQHSIYTAQGMSSGMQEPLVRHKAGLWAAMRYSVMARTNPEDAKGFLNAAKVQGIKT